MKFRKKPVVVEAEQYDGSAEQVKRLGLTEIRLEGPPRHYVSTLEGKMKISPGDWIITGIAGERYPCKPDIFAATYESADAPDRLARALDLLERHGRYGCAPMTWFVRVAELLKECGR